MKRRLNTIFFCICFIAAVIAETYCFISLNGDFISVTGIGIVVLITGYLLLDSLRSNMTKGIHDIRFYIDHMYLEETKNWNARMDTLFDIQKATYAATKKSTAELNEKFDLIINSLEKLEESNIEAMQRITKLQKMSLDGQKNGLNLSVNYEKENTSQILQLLEGNHTAQTELIQQILSQIKTNPGRIEVNKGLDISSNNNTEINKVEDKSDMTQVDPNMGEGLPTAQKEAEEKPTVIPLYDDPNKNLTADEISALFASYGQ